MPADGPLAIHIFHLDMDDLIERAFAKASADSEKQNVSRLKPIVKARIKEKIRLRTASYQIIRSLSRLHSSIPPSSKISPFYRDLLEILGAGELQDARREIGRAIGDIRRLSQTSLSKMDRARKPNELHAIRKKAYGRISTRVRSLSRVARYLAEVGPKLRELPSIKPELPTLVIAGYPNVGKTTLLRELTGSAPEIKPIPFTTQKIQMGYMQVGWNRIQVIDTPGLLDRPLESRNPVEMKAIGALKHLSNLVLFLVDPTTHGGFLLEDQLGLLAQVTESFPSPIIVAVNKEDVATPEDLERTLGSLAEYGGGMVVSGQTGLGIEELRGKISSNLIESSPK
jgi:nucleolar GTP-binding protein